MHGSEMGCGLSSAQFFTNTSASTKAEESNKLLKMSSCHIAFNKQQLMKLNCKFYRLLDQTPISDPERDRKTLLRLGAVVERLVQRLICTVGYLDPRFSSKFLITLDQPSKVQRGLKYHYMIRLDGLSTPALYPEMSPPVKIIEGMGNTPNGFARIQLLGEYIDLYSDFINHSGYLRRDKIQERFMDLLAMAAARPGHPYSPLDVDESAHCGCPGKIIDPLALHHGFSLSADQQMFHGSGEADEVRFPDPRDFRLAIVEGVPEIRIHVSFLSSAVQSDEDIEVVLTLGIGVNDWPKSSDFPSRLPVDHTDIILAYQAAQTGYFVVPYGPHHTVQCEDRTSLWQIRTPALDTLLECHYAPHSVISRCKHILSSLMNSLQSRGVKSLNRHIMQVAFNFEMENKPRLIHWSPQFVSRRILRILDGLAMGLREHYLRSYIFPGVNLLLQPCITEEDCCSDADIIETYLEQLRDRINFEVDIESSSVQDHLENVMIQKWNNIINNLRPLDGQKKRRLSLTTTSIQYSRRQMEYIAVLLREMLKLKAVQSKVDLVDENAVANTESDSFRRELIFLLQLMCDQGKTAFLSKVITKNERRNTSDTIEIYDVSAALMIDGVKRMELSSENLKTDMHLVAKVLECLYSAIDSDPKVLKPILLPYLNQLFIGSHENCWFLQEWLQKSDNSELNALGAFTSVVLTGQQNPLEALKEASEKGWQWAKITLRTLQIISDKHCAEVILGDRSESPDSGLRLIFTPSYLQAVRLTVRNELDKESMPVIKAKEKMPRSRVKEKRRKSSDSRYATIRSLSDSLYPEENTINRKTHCSKTILAPNGDLPMHSKLRNTSPLVTISESMRRRGTNRGLGGIVQALVSLEKLTVLQEMAIHLPDHERTRVLSDVQKLTKEVQRLSISRRRNAMGRSNRRFSFRRYPKRNLSLEEGNRSATLPPPRHRFKNEEVYRKVKDPSEGDPQSDKKKLQEEIPAYSGTLVGTCRKLRTQNTEIGKHFLDIPNNSGKHTTDSNRLELYTTSLAKMTSITNHDFP